VSARAWLLAAVVLASACGGARKSADTPKLPPARPEAVSKMAQAVQAARDAEGKQRALGLFEQAVRADAQLWEARYNLGVLHAEIGNLARAERELA
jgi:cytochrome c-type biogenesis protein CcmH/NrfG